MLSWWFCRKVDFLKRINKWDDTLRTRRRARAMSGSHCAFGSSRQSKHIPPLEATQGQIDGFLSQFPCKCHLEEVASVGYWIKICSQLDSRVGEMTPWRRAGGRGPCRGRTAPWSRRDCPSLPRLSLSLSIYLSIYINIHLYICIYLSMYLCL